MVDASLYPDVARAGLAPALADAARRLGVDIGEVVPSEFSTGAVLVAGPRRVSVNVAVERRAFHLTAHAGENVHASGVTTDLAEAVRVAATWIQGASLRGLNAQHPFMRFKPLAEGFERGDPVEVQWAQTLADPNLRDVHPLLRLIRSDSRLGHLFPSVTHYTWVRIHLDPVDRGAGQLWIMLTSRGYDVRSSWDEVPRSVATIEEAVEAAATLLPAE